MSSSCFVCEEEISKYKCPTCLVHYCSVGCYQKHKENCIKHQEPLSKTSVTCDKLCEKPKEYQFETEDTVKLEKLQLLGRSKRISTLLKNPHLREFLQYLNTCTDPWMEVAQAFQDPIFSEYADECLKVVEGNEPNDSSDSELSD